MTILIFNTFYYPKFIGGAEISVQLLAEGLVKAGNKVFVITSGNKRSVNNINGVVVIRINQKNIFSTFKDRKWPGLLRVIWHLIDSYNLMYYFLVSKLITKIKPDIVHTNNIQGFSPFIFKIIKMKGIPLVHTLRDYYLLCHRNNLFNNGKVCDKLCVSCQVTYSVKKVFLNLPDKYVCISQFILDKHNDYFAIENKSLVVYNAVNTPKQVSNKKTEKIVVFGYIGRISKDKGVEYLITEINKVKKELKSRFKILFAGKGDHEYIIELEKRLMGIKSEFLGVVKPEDFYCNIDVLIAPSLWYEPFGRVVIESLSYGVPVCISDSGGLKELHNPACTWLFKPDNDMLYPEIEQIIQNSNDISLKKEACIKHAQSFSSNLYIENYLNVYSALKN